MWLILQRDGAIIVGLVNQKRGKDKVEARNSCKHPRHRAPLDEVVKHEIGKDGSEIGRRQDTDDPDANFPGMFVEEEDVGDYGKTDGEIGRLEGRLQASHGVVGREIGCHCASEGKCKAQQGGPE